MNINIRNIIICGCVTFGIGLTSCEDMLTMDTGDKTNVNANDTLYSYLGIMRAMQDVAERQVILGEIRGDLVSSTTYTTDTLYAISNFDDPKDQSCSMLQISDYYNVINNCNFYIHNCDTNQIKSNVKYMIPEYTQVKAIRAWAYLQLVKNYKEVPYITEPISNLDVIKNFDYNNNKVNKDNLIDKFIEDGLPYDVNVKYPQYGNSKEEYGSFNNGNVSISAKLLMIPIRVLLGDAYLLRGSSKSDYENAAKYYFDYLKNEETPMNMEYCTVYELRSGSYLYATYNWGTWSTIYNTNAEVITSIPSSSNSGLGKMLTRVANIYGYNTTSTQTSEESTSTSDDGEEETSYEKGGAITVNPTYKRQYGPSNSYYDVNNSQTYVIYQNATTSNPKVSYILNMDARKGMSVLNLTYEGESYPLCRKACPLETFGYCIPIYRKSLIWLRLAEAINRAGYPEFAFAILKDGINQYTIPKVVTTTTYNNIITYLDGVPYYTRKNYETGEVLYVDTVAGSKNYMYFDENNEFVSYPSTVYASEFRLNQDTIYGREMNYGTYGALYYLTDTLKLNSFIQKFDFTDDVWNNTYGIHAKGAGFGGWTTTNLSNNISGYRDTVYYDFFKLLKLQNVDIETATEDDIINGVENIIVDELALETAFEGNRFYDLVRIAEHKENAGLNGKDWLARKIANRGTKKAIEGSKAVEDFNTSIYNKLMDKNNWYFTLPAWNVK